MFFIYFAVICFLFLPYTFIDIMQPNYRKDLRIGPNYKRVPGPAKHQEHNGGGVGEHVSGGP
jgi:hypothetical protein